MKSEIIKPNKERSYPCIVEDWETGDGSDPTLWLMHSQSVGTVVRVGSMAKQMDWTLGQVIDTATNDDWDDEFRDRYRLFEGIVKLSN